ncbi:MAG TPA: ATP-binding protein, partial [Bradyrhizobium sp.]|nr:ATP-binding protein [Bradyrhizobium sp.]
ASAPIPRSFRSASAQRSPTATTIDSVVAKGPQNQGSVVATSTRLAGSRVNDVWMRVMLLAPSASRSLNATVLGDTDMSSMRAYFVKPQAAIAMAFCEDPQMGMLTERFTGSATAKLVVMQTASLR